MSITLSKENVVFYRNDKTYIQYNILKQIEQNKQIYDVYVNIQNPDIRHIDIGTDYT